MVSFLLESVQKRVKIFELKFFEEFWYVILILFQKIFHFFLKLRASEKKLASELTLQALMFLAGKYNFNFFEHICFLYSFGKFL